MGLDNRSVNYLMIKAQADHKTPARGSARGTTAYAVVFGVLLCKTPACRVFRARGTTAYAVVFGVLLCKTPARGSARDRSGILFCRGQKRYKRIARSGRRPDAPKNA
jgi:hypothetical protein